MLFIVVLLLTIVEHSESKLFYQSYINANYYGKQFYPAHPNELLETVTTPSLFRCIQGEFLRDPLSLEIIIFVIACNVNIYCRTLDYDSVTCFCRLYESAVTTGSIVPTVSSYRVGALQFPQTFFDAYNQPCSECTEHRYLICSNDTCGCPPLSFWNGVQCENQRYQGAPCNQSSWCRSDIQGLACSSSNVCLGMYEEIPPS